MSLVILSAIIFIPAVFLAWRATKNILSPVFISMGIFFFFYVGGLIYFVTDNHPLTPLYFSIGALFYGLGAFIIAGFFRFKPDTELKDFKQKPLLNIFPSKKIFFISLIVIFVFSIALTFYYFYYVGIPLFQSSKVTTIAHGGKGIFFRGFTTFLPLILLVTYLFRKTTKKLSVKFFWWTIIITSLASIILYGSRGIVLVFLMPFILLYSLFRVKRDLSKIGIVFLFFVLVAVSFQYSYPEYQKLSIKDSFVNVFNRMTVSQAMGMDYAIYNLVPDEDLYMGKKSMSDFKGFLSTLRIISQGELFSERLFEKINFNYEGEARLTISTTSIGDLYIDFSLIGIAFGMFFYGVIAQGLYVKVVRGVKDCFLLVVYSYLQYILIATHIGGAIFSALANMGISLIMFIIIIASINIFLLLPLSVGRMSLRLSKHFI